MICTAARHTMSASHCARSYRETPLALVNGQRTRELFSAPKLGSEFRHRPTHGMSLFMVLRPPRSEGAL